MRNKFTILCVVIAHVFVIAGLTFFGGCKSTGPSTTGSTASDRRAFSGFSGPGESGASGYVASTTVAQPAPAPAAAPAAVEQPTNPPSAVGSGKATTSAAPAPVAAAEPAPAAVAATEPVDAPVAATEPKAVGTGRTYVVKKNDSLWIIAKREGVSVNELTEANGLKKNAMLREGQKLTIPASSGHKSSGSYAASAPASGSHKEAAASSGDVYVVKSGDVLGSIAKRLGTTSSALRETNGIKGDSIRVGQKLKVPAGAKAKGGVAEVAHTATAKSGTATTATATAAAASPTALKDVPMFGQSAPAAVSAETAPAPAPVAAPAPEAVEAVPVSK